MAQTQTSQIVPSAIAAVLASKGKMPKPDLRGIPQTQDKNQIIKRDFSYSQVDIIVPFHGQYEKVTRLVEGIYRTTRRPFLLTLVDDASPNEQFIQSMRENTNINCIRNEAQLGFGASLKVGFENTSFPWVVFMHSDCAIENPNWLNILGESMFKMKNNGVKMISAVMDNPGSADGIHPKMKTDYSKLQFNAPDLDLPDIVLGENHHLPLICTLSHRDLYKNIGGFIKSYPYCMYESEELAHRMKYYGFKQALCQKCWIKHDGSATVNALIKEKGNEVIEVFDDNFIRCMSDIQNLK